MVQQGLQTVFATERPVYICASSATGLMEAGVRCAPEGPVLSLVNGAFSERFANIAKGCGRVTERYEVAWGEVHDPEALDALLSANRYAAITVVHSETSTGARNDVHTISAIARRHGVTCLVDSVSGVGGVEFQFDAWELDYALTGSQKALALPPGLAFGVASSAFIEHARTVPGRGIYFDLVEHDHFARQGQVPSTPALSLYYALERQLQDVTHDGISVRWARHMAMAERTWRWIETMQRELHAEIRAIAPAGHRSPTVTAVGLPSFLNGEQVVSAIQQLGFTVGAGYGKLRSTTFRIGHMGDHTAESVQRCLDACETALRSLISTAKT
jgi:aspartate aminotransferase-like enzyme